MSIGYPGTSSFQGPARTERRDKATPQERGPIPAELPTPRDRKWRTLPPKLKGGGSAERKYEVDDMIKRGLSCGSHL